MTDPLDAYRRVHQLAFAPLLFQAARAARDLGVLAAMDHRRPPPDLDAIATTAGVSRYAARVLVDACAAQGLVAERDGGFALTTAGRLVLHDRMVRVHMDFVHDVCYRGAFHLDTALRDGTPAGLAELGPWPTVYAGLAELPEHVRASWFAFDHYWSDAVFREVLPLVFAHRPRRLLDVGGNTGRWAQACVAHDPVVEVTIVDLPGQLATAAAAIGASPRIHLVAADLLDREAPLPAGFDVVFMSQFLDCFGEDDIVVHLRRAAAALAPGGRIAVLEPCTDRQPNDVAALCLHATSLYFTCIANGTSRMYRATDLLDLAGRAGLRAAEEVRVGLSHTLFGFVPAA